MAHTAAEHHDDHHGHKQGFVERWFFSTNHKDIGTLYLLFSFVMFIIGAAMSVVIRAELATPGLQVVSPEFFNQMTTVHALVMIFGGVMPAFVGLANWMVPLQIGAPDMALPRMNNWSFWLLPVAFTLLLISLFLPGGAPAGGWTLYPPLSLQGGYNVAFTIFAIHVAGISSIMGAINIIATILNMRAPGIDLLKMPIFCWTWLITAFLLIAVMPVLAGAVTMLLTDKFFGTSFFLGWLAGNVFAPAFALLHSAGVALALRMLWSNGERGEEIAIGPRAVEVRRGAETVFSAHPYWVRLQVAPEDGMVMLSSGGRDVEVGAFLGPGERRQLARCLREFLAAASGRNR